MGKFEPKHDELYEIAARNGVSASTVRTRLFRGWSERDAVLPSRVNRRCDDCASRVKARLAADAGLPVGAFDDLSIGKIADLLGISRQTLYARLRRGYSGNYVEKVRQSGRPVSGAQAGALKRAYRSR